MAPGRSPRIQRTCCHVLVEREIAREVCTANSFVLPPPTGVDTLYFYPTSCTRFKYRIMPIEHPVLSLTQFVLASGFFAGSYVGSIYVLRSARLDSKDKSRDDPSVIKARLTAVSASTAGSLLGVATIVWKAGKYPTIIDAIRPATQCLGLVLPSPALRPLLLTPILYLGPFYTAWLDKSLPFMEHWWYKRDVVDRFASWTGIRNYFASPLTEELVYRSCIVGAAKLAGIGPKKIIFLTPLWFGENYLLDPVMVWSRCVLFDTGDTRLIPNDLTLAHIHHAHEQYNRLGRTKNALQRALVISIIQLGYTTLFGWYASFLFLRTGSVITPTLAHTFCNIMGMPTIQDDIRQHPNRKLLIWLTHIMGIVGFGFALGPWTRS
ncbi:unnamed protein product [Rhizoctonia solani]|uniref:intramembrane prenyl-peptidase Rce1 n=1 Tax=Rhizoctonia solani TaxID=456999 RepID=A0A8H3GZY4_9AGAM|nr:unnamed protein product [Rhizoctonia solani]